MSEQHSVENDATIAGHFCGQSQPHAAHTWQTPPVYGEATFTSTYQCAGVTPEPHGVALDKGKGIVCLCGEVCNAEMGRAAAPLMGSTSDTFVKVNAGTVFARHLREARARPIPPGRSSEGGQNRGD